MDQEFWLERWQKNQIGFHQRAINPYLESCWHRIAPAPDAVIFVPMCGKSRDMQWLRERGHAVIGVELIRIAVRDFFRELSLEPRIVREGPLERWEASGYTLFCGDLFDLTAAHLRDVRAVFDRASLIALPPATRTRYVRHMTDIVPMRAPTLLVTMTYAQEQMAGPPFSVSEPEVRTLYIGCRVEKLMDVDVLQGEDNARFRERGVTAMAEQVYRIDRHA